MRNKRRIEQLLESDKMLIDNARLGAWVEAVAKSDDKSDLLFPVVIQLQDVDAVRACMSRVDSGSDGDSIVQRLTIHEEAFPIAYAQGQISIPELEWLLEQDFVVSIEEDDAYFPEHGAPS